MKEKRKKREAWIQVRTTPEAKEFLKKEFGSESDFVRVAIAEAAKEKGVTICLI